MMYQQVGEARAVFTSDAGDDDHAAWYHNLLAHPDVTAEVGCTALALHARVLDDAERAPIWERYGDAGDPRRATIARRRHGPSRLSTSFQRVIRG